MTAERTTTSCVLLLTSLCKPSTHQYSTVQQRRKAQQPGNKKVLCLTVRQTLFMSLGRSKLRLFRDRWPQSTSVFLRICRGVCSACLHNAQVVIRESSSSYKHGIILFSVFRISPQPSFRKPHYAFWVILSSFQMLQQHPSTYHHTAHTHLGLHYFIYQFNVGSGAQSNKQTVRPLIWHTTCGDAQRSG